MELKASDLAKEWKAGRFRPVYYLIGEEAGRAQAAAELKARFKDDPFNFREFSGDMGQEAAAAVSEAATLPVLGDRRLVLMSNPKIPAEAKAVLADYLKEPLETTTLVLHSEERKADPRDSLVKACLAAGAVCVFSALSEEQAQEKLKAEARRMGRTLADEAAATLVAEAGTDWGILSQELEKAALFAAAPEIGQADVLECLGYRKSADPFLLARLIQERRLKESLTHLRRLFQEGKADDQAFRALSQITTAIHKQLKAKRLLEAGTPQETVFRSLRLHSWWDRDYLPKLQRLPEARLARDLRRCVETDAALKSQGWLDPKVELELLIKDLC